jgi:hypothetical protein
MEAKLTIDQTKQNYDAILKVLAKEVNAAMKAVSASVIAQIKPIVGEAILQSYEMRSLLGGSLQGHLGIRPGDNDNAVFQITNAIMSAIYVEWTPLTTSQPGKLNIFIQPNNFANLLSLRAGENDAVHKTDGAYTMEWLDWLLRMGDTPIVKGYEYQAGITGRSGQGIMKKKAGSVWRVPPEFAGTIDDNFVTRALDDEQVESQIAKILKKTIQ